MIDRKAVQAGLRSKKTKGQTLCLEGEATLKKTGLTQRPAQRMSEGLRCLIAERPPASEGQSNTSS